MTEPSLYGGPAGRRVRTHHLADAKRRGERWPMMTAYDQYEAEIFDQAGIPWEDHVVIDDAFKRPAEVDLLVGDYGKAERQLGWKPATDFEQLIRLMVDADLKLLGG